MPPCKCHSVTMEHKESPRYQIKRSSTAKVNGCSRQWRPVDAGKERKLPNEGNIPLYNCTSMKLIRNSRKTAKVKLIVGICERGSNIGRFPGILRADPIALSH